MGKILEMTDVTKVYHEGSVDVTAVDSVTLDLRKGEVLLLMGPSGSGKTTLLSMMGCILHPTKGEIKVDGEVVSICSKTSFRKYASAISASSSRHLTFSPPLPPGRTSRSA